MAIYFLGGGNMAQAIIGRLRAKSSETHIFVANRSESKKLILKEKFGVETDFRLPETLSPDDVLILAVKPQDMKNALANVQHGGALVLSLAAGLDIETLSKWLNTKRIIRAMPNTPCAVGMGVSGLFADENVGDDDKKIAEQIMANCGVTLWLENENMMHNITAISGSGSAYVFYLMNALQKSAENLGFSGSQAKELALNTFRGAVALAEQSGDDFVSLQQQVTSKGGTTFAALTVFDEKGVADGIERGTQAAAARSAELAHTLKD